MSKENRDFSFYRHRQLNSGGLLNRPNKCYPHVHDSVYVVDSQGKNIGSCGLTSGDLDVEFNFRDKSKYTYTLTDKPVKKYMGNLRRKIKLTKSEEKKKTFEEQLKGLESADKIVVERRVTHTWDSYS